MGEKVKHKEMKNDFWNGDDPIVRLSMAQDGTIKSYKIYTGSWVTTRHVHT